MLSELSLPDGGVHLPTTSSVPQGIPLQTTFAACVVAAAAAAGAWAYYAAVAVSMPSVWPDPQTVA